MTKLNGSSKAAGSTIKVGLAPVRLSRGRASGQLLLRHAARDRNVCPIAYLATVAPNPAGRPAVKRVALLGTRGIPAQHGGFETAVQFIGPGLVDHGWDVTVYCRTLWQHLRALRRRPAGQPALPAPQGGRNAQPHRPGVPGTRRSGTSTWRSCSTAATPPSCVHCTSGEECRWPGAHGRPGGAARQVGGVRGEVLRLGRAHQRQTCRRGSSPTPTESPTTSGGPTAARACTFPTGRS